MQRSGRFPLAKRKATGLAVCSLRLSNLSVIAGAIATVVLGQIIRIRVHGASSIPSVQNDDIKVDRPIQVSHWTKMDRYPDEYLAVKEILKTSWSNTSTLKLLSFGSSTGEEAITLATRYFTRNEGFFDVAIYGFDIDDPTLNEAKKKVESYGRQLPIRFFDGKNTSLKVHGKYDAIFANSVLCHHDVGSVPITMEVIESRFTFQDFETSLLSLDAALNDGGVLAMVNTNYNLIDTVLAGRYDPVAQCSGNFVPRIDVKNHELIESTENTAKDCVWKKKSSI
jgi:hypothetical protein